MNARLTMAAAITQTAYASTLLEATTAHVNKDTNSKRTVKSIVKVSEIVMWWAFHFYQTESLENEDSFFYCFGVGNGRNRINYIRFKMKTLVWNAENDTQNPFPYKNILLFWGGGGGI